MANTKGQRGSNATRKLNREPGRDAGKAGSGTGTTKVKHQNGSKIGTVKPTWKSAGTGSGTGAKVVPSKSAKETVQTLPDTTSDEESEAGNRSLNGRVSGSEPEPEWVEPRRKLVPVTETGRNYVSRFAYQVLSFKPRALLYHGFATSEQCDEMVALAKRKKLTPSLTKGQRPGDPQRARTSWGVFLPPKADGSGVVGELERKLAEAIMIPEDHGEEFNVLRYEIGQKYTAHFDDPCRNPGLRESGRMASFLLYLSDVAEGGETCFPCENGDEADSDCDGFAGFKVKPRKGDALLFYTFRPDGTHDEASLHCSCPVVRGEKWVATKWIHEKPVY
ncbi:Prolyl 4-hydroxylase alpha subunit [Klebsormidium nitens]|uniref:Prolyl 4-hydroxylase alpha subunit n=1 Tax=Klebsormidium nitens TaxID=105231 RepID=A0A1Y1I8U3_KLENI|nr:Prolyl 4-hydroxylase alpha subunit [Klebsormidium nitens]|eukprot:GAQ84518.1 Prolyl 4-hydroxylase alpha subunit [Klebsormidium nitens]